MKVVVVGGTNFLGPSLVRDLVAAGHGVTIVHSGAHEAGLPQVDHVHVGRDQLREARNELARPGQLRAGLGSDEWKRLPCDAFHGGGDV